jgi:hypothetical protein
MSERNSEAEERARQWLRRFGDEVKANGMTMAEAIQLLAEQELDNDPLMKAFSEDERASRIQGRARPLPPPSFDFERGNELVRERAEATDRVNLKLALKNSEEREVLLTERTAELRKANDALDRSLHNGELLTMTRYDIRTKKR